MKIVKRRLLSMMQTFSIDLFSNISNHFSESIFQITYFPRNERTLNLNLIDGCTLNYSKLKTIEFFIIIFI